MHAVCYSLLFEQLCSMLQRQLPMHAVMARTARFCCAVHSVETICSWLAAHCSIECRFVMKHLVHKRRMQSCVQCDGQSGLSLVDLMQARMLYGRVSHITKRIHALQGTFWAFTELIVHRRGFAWEGFHNPYEVLPNVGWLIRTIKA